MKIPVEPPASLYLGRNMAAELDLPVLQRHIGRLVQAGELGLLGFLAVLARAAPRLLRFGGRVCERVFCHSIVKRPSRCSSVLRNGRRVRRNGRHRSIDVIVGLDRILIAADSTHGPRRRACRKHISFMFGTTWGSTFSSISTCSTRGSRLGSAIPVVGLEPRRLPRRFKRLR